MTGPIGHGLSRKNTELLDVPDPPEIKPDDIVIAVMGITGCGKTTFVNHFSDYPLMIGHGLDSCTQIVQVVPCTLDSGKKIYLVDTPGFDDSTRTDSEILREVALWLNAAHKSKLKLTGLILLHRIIDVRVGGSGVRNIKMFKKLCGDDTLASVVLATTMWDYNTNEEVGNEREAQLHREPLLWKPMIEQGSKVYRQNNGRKSAMLIIQYLIDTKRPVTLDIQREMVDQKLQLGQTGAGSEVASEVEKAKRHYDKRLKDLEIQLQDALAKQDHERREEIEDAKLEFQSRLSRGQDELKRLQADTNDLQEEMKKRYETEMEEMAKAMQQKERAIQESQMEVLMLKETHAHDLEMQKLQLQMKWKEKYYQMMYGPAKCTVM
ncbi:hypothetical protein K505DRAFT_406338 [Melanomma pulvis-pyrius CBS 109.77]|uniref:G domain-containing protein n=1 Tax=Melanomma pulvis-pyrius CBS 109.77 TaxID=1314802 RepID=A0A6A6XJX6_9PLEO|nr:hypothetical protein K505DRAFT_406338 [Melanomma pulvis-pyrius CBS 109.77]